MVLFDWYFAEPIGKLHFFIFLYDFLYLLISSKQAIMVIFVHQLQLFLLPFMLREHQLGKMGDFLWHGFKNPSFMGQFVKVFLFGNIPNGLSKRSIRFLFCHMDIKIIFDATSAKAHHYNFKHVKVINIVQIYATFTIILLLHLQQYLNFLQEKQ